MRGEGSPPPGASSPASWLWGAPTEPSVLVSPGGRSRCLRPASLREAIDAGVVVLVREGAWFRHPLLADVLLDSFLPGEAGAVHAAWAGHLEQLTTGGVDQLRPPGDLATHHEQAGAALRGVRTLAARRRHRGAARRLQGIAPTS